MGGIVGRLFREFAVTLSAAILVSLVVSLTTTPMMCSRLLKHQRPEDHGRLYRASEKVFHRILRLYDRSFDLGAASSCADARRASPDDRRQRLSARRSCPKDFFPQQDTGRMTGGIQGAQDSSFQAMKQRMTRFVEIIRG